MLGAKCGAQSVGAQSIGAESLRRRVEAQSMERKCWGHKMLGAQSLGVQSMGTQSEYSRSNSHFKILAYVNYKFVLTRAANSFKLLSKQCKNSCDNSCMFLPPKLWHLLYLTIQLV